MSSKILLAEDNEMNRDMLSRRLTRYGYEVIVATNGQEAVELCAAETPHLVLMDLSMPVLDGWEASRQLKEDEGTKQIPIIALTAHAIKGDREKALEAGCDEFLTKPIDMKQLLKLIKQLLG